MWQVLKAPMCCWGVSTDCAKSESNLSTAVLTNSDLVMPHSEQYLSMLSSVSVETDPLIEHLQPLFLLLGLFGLFFFSEIIASPRIL